VLTIVALVICSIADIVLEVIKAANYDLHDYSKYEVYVETVNGFSRYSIIRISGAAFTAFIVLILYVDVIELWERVDIVRLG
jgi:hypothetical protein